MLTVITRNVHKIFSAAKKQKSNSTRIILLDILSCKNYLPSTVYLPLLSTSSAHDPRMSRMRMARNRLYTTARSDVLNKVLNETSKHCCITIYSKIDDCRGLFANTELFFKRKPTPRATLWRRISSRAVAFETSGFCQWLLLPLTSFLAQGQIQNRAAFVDRRCCRPRHFLGADGETETANWIAVSTF